MSQTPDTQSYDQDDVLLMIEHVINKRAGPPVLTHAPVPTPAQPPAWLVILPAWLTLFFIMIGGYTALCVRLSTVEYRAETSAADRLDIHRQIDKGNDALSSMRADISGIRVSIDELLARTSGRSSSVPAAPSSN